MKRAAWWLLAAHAALIGFATVALVTIVAGGLPESMRTAVAVQAYTLGWRFSGPAYVVLGALAVLLHAAHAYGWRRAVAVLATAAALALTAELLGTSTGLPFGPYEYTSLLGYRIAGHVPFPIPLSWYLMLYCALAICARVLPSADDARTRIAWACVAGAVLTAWDVAMDPAMSAATNHWVWHVAGAYYGMPLSNWVGWYVTGTAIAFAMLAIVPPTVIARRVAPSTFPMVMYAINGVMPVALCARHDMWPAALLGAGAMTVPVAMALRTGSVCASSS